MNRASVHTQTRKHAHYRLRILELSIEGIADSAGREQRIQTLVTSSLLKIGDDKRKPTAVRVPGGERI